MSESGTTLIEVPVLGIPVAVWAKTQEHLDELVREFTLMAAREHEDPLSGDVPARLLELVEELTAQYGGLNTDQEDRLSAAAETGVPEIDLVYRVPAQAAQASQHLQAILDEADAYCRSGTHLLTLAAPPESARFRHWFLDEFINQLDGRPPTPYPQYET